MSITIYHSEGIILSYVDIGEADRIFNIYTKDFGMLSVFAKGIRLSKAKLRYHVTLFSHLRISFVQGKDFLRLTDAESFKKFQNPDNLEVFTNCTKLLERMIVGQEKDEKIWDLLLSSFEFLSRIKETPELFNLLFGVRLLHRLGYVGEVPDNLAGIIKNDAWEYFVEPQSTQLEQIFEKGLQASHL